MVLRGWSGGGVCQTARLQLPSPIVARHGRSLSASSESVLSVKKKKKRIHRIIDQTARHLRVEKSGTKHDI